MARKKSNKAALKIIVDERNKRIDFKIIRGKEIDFDPSQGTTRKATVLCPVCGAGIDDRIVRREAKEGRMDQRLITVILHNPKTTGSIFRIADERDIKVFNQAQLYLQGKVKNLAWDFSPIPDEALDPHSMKQRTMWLYGMPKWGDLFNARQKLAMVTFVDKVRLAYQKMVKEDYNKEYAKTITTYLALAIDKLSANLCSLSRYRSDNESIERALDRQAFPMIWDYGEINPFDGSRGDWRKIIDDILEVLKKVSLVKMDSGYVHLGTATSLPYPDEFFDAVVTDPPYYDNVNYAELADFFYVWLKRTIGDLHSELFSTPLTPKSQEIVMNPTRHDTPENAKIFFENMMTKWRGSRSLKDEMQGLTRLSSGSSPSKVH